MQWWSEAKDLLERSVSFSADAIHVIAGVVVTLASALLLRRPVTSWVPWLVAFAFTVLNEFVDMSVDYWTNMRAAQLGESVSDLLLTMALPTLLLFASRRFPGLWRARDRQT